MVRDTPRRELSELGAVAISTGLYLSPHDLVDALHGDSGPYLSTATTYDLDIHGTTDPRDRRVTLAARPHRQRVQGHQRCPS
jgi:phenylacetic acid degradation operon negative regulatory protein